MSVRVKFFEDENLQGHSEAKVKLLGAYLNAYIPIISNSPYESIHLYDLFSGPGYYKNEKKGSALIIIEAIANTIKNGQLRNTSIYVHFNDFNPEKIEGLKQNIQKFYPGIDKQINLKFTSKDYEQIFPEVSHEVEYSKGASFVFIDPCTYKEIKGNQLKKLMGKSGVEVLLFLPVNFMYRVNTNGTPGSLELLKKEIGLTEECKNVHEFIDLFRSKLDTFFKGQKFVDTFKLQRGTNNWFSLFFITSNIKGFEKMLAAKWKVDDEEGIGFKFEQTPSLFGQANDTKLEKFLKDYLKTPRTNGELYEAVLRSSYLPSQANEVLRKFEQYQLLKKEMETGEKPRKNAYYLTYDEYKNCKLGKWKLKLFLRS